MKKIKTFFSLAFIFSAFATADFAQTPPINEVNETVITEEIKLNVSAFDASGQFASDLRKEDLVILEDGRLQQASAVRRVPANVLIVLDTGGEMRGNLSTTRTAAKNLVESLAAGDSISIFQYGDKVERLSDWTADKVKIFDVLDNKLTFGKRSVLNQALNEAIKYFNSTPLENRHLILITSGIDSFNDSSARQSAVANLMVSDINVHVISYTYLRKGSISSQKAIFNKGNWKPRRLPDQIADTLPNPKRPGLKEEEQEVTPRDTARMPRLGGITLDRERTKRAKESTNELVAAENFLNTIADDTNGLFLLPETTDEMIAKTSALAKIIDAQYVVAYSPRRSLRDSPGGEIRQISVSSKRDGIQAEAHRKLVVEKKTKANDQR